MSYQPSTFPTDLGIATRVGLTRGVGGTGPGLGSFAEAEMHYREERLIADLLRRKNQEEAGRADRAGRFGRQGMTRWTTWLPSVPLLHRSSPARPSSPVCEN
jgi:hypothetical protein